MPQSLVKNYVHIVFSTKYRQPLITTEIEPELYAYLGGICKNQNCMPIRVGGFVDHVHILCSLSKNIMLCTLLEHLKSHSSKWIKQRGDSFHSFRWQSGYGAFSVDWRGLDIVEEYIARQHEHHKLKKFQDEYRSLLNEYRITFDEQYVWD